MAQIGTRARRGSGHLGARRIYETLRDQILARTYGTDGVLPSSRSLAGELGVSRSTVTVAYEQLAAEGFIEVRHGARPRVARSVVGVGKSRAVAAPQARVLPLSEFGKRLRVGYLIVPTTLVSAFAAAKQIMDRHSPLAEQDAPASMLESGSYDSHVRRVPRRNAERRQVLLEALRRQFGDSVRIEGAVAGLHVVVWFDDLPARWEEALVRTARSKGVGIYPVSALYDRRRRGRARRDAVGLVMG